MTSPYAMMQRAVDIVRHSPHETNKIAATLYGTAPDGSDFIIARTNFWPESIEKALGQTGKIGSSSGTIHAETACILEAPMTRDSALFITDPPCPNCAKNIAEAGIKTLYIDHKGFEKDFAQRRGADIRAMSLHILEAAGISVYKIYRREEKIEPVLVISDDYEAPLENPVVFSPLEQPPSAAVFAQCIARANTHYNGTPYALCLAHNVEGQIFEFSASAHPAVGFTRDDNLEGEGKYSFWLQPINRILMAGRFRGVIPIADYIFSSRIPTSRECVNYIGAGYNSLYVGDPANARDKDGLNAKDQLEKLGLMTFKTL